MEDHGRLRVSPILKLLSTNESMNVDIRIGIRWPVYRPLSTNIGIRINIHVLWVGLIVVGISSTRNKFDTFIYPPAKLEKTAVPLFGITWYVLLKQ